MKKILFAFSVFALICSNGFAGDKLESSLGYWDFDGWLTVEKPREGYFVFKLDVTNNSTDDSYANGAGSVVIDWELWNPDAGLIDSGSITIRDIPRGRDGRCAIDVEVPIEYNVLEFRYNITTPNGGHSFQRGSQTFFVR